MTHLNLAAQNKITASSSATDRKISVFSGHDTVIAPVLAALGVYRGSLCAWPAYASRIVFELWRPSEESLDATSTVAGGSAAVTSGTDNETNSGGSYVRVVYNGVDITQLIPACAVERRALIIAGDKGSPSRADSYLLASKSPLCSLVALNAQIDEMIHPHSSIQQACE